MSSVLRHKLRSSLLFRALSCSALFVFGSSVRSSVPFLQGQHGRVVVVTDQRRPHADQSVDAVAVYNDCETAVPRNEILLRGERRIEEEGSEDDSRADSEDEGAGGCLLAPVQQCMQNCMPNCVQTCFCCCGARENGSCCGPQNRLLAGREWQEDAQQKARRRVAETCCMQLALELGCFAAGFGCELGLVALRHGHHVHSAAATVSACCSPPVWSAVARKGHCGWLCLCAGHCSSCYNPESCPFCAVCQTAQSGACDRAFPGWCGPCVRLCPSCCAPADGRGLDRW